MLKSEEFDKVDFKYRSIKVRAIQSAKFASQTEYRSNKKLIYYERCFESFTGIII